MKVVLEIFSLGEYQKHFIKEIFMILFEKGSFAVIDV